MNFMLSFLFLCAFPPLLDVHMYYYKCAELSTKNPTHTLDSKKTQNNNKTLKQHKEDENTLCNTNRKSYCVTASLKILTYQRQSWYFPPNNCFVLFFCVVSPCVIQLSAFVLSSFFHFFFCFCLGKGPKSKTNMQTVHKNKKWAFIMKS